MDNSFNNRLVRAILVVFCLFLIVIVSYLFLYYMYPFVIAFMISMLLHPIVTLCERKWKLNRGFTTLFVLIIFFCISLISGYFITKQIVQELTELFVKLPTYIESIVIVLHRIENTYVTLIYDYINKVTFIDFPENISITKFLEEKMTVNIAEFLQRAIVLLSQLFTSFAYTSFVFLFIVLATYFIAKDFEKIMHLLQKGIPTRVNNLLSRINEFARQSTFGIVKAQISIALLTAVIAFFGLLLFKTEHLFIITGILFVIDLIPYVGIGALFIPWIVYAFFSDHYALTLKLSLLYAVLIIVRQIIEPRLLAKNLGIHPLIAIIILFISINMFGALGFIITPISLILFSSLYHAKIIHYIIRFIKEGIV